MARPMRSLTEPPGLRYSSFARSLGLMPRPTRSSRAIGDALEKVQGLDGKTVVDATNLVGTEPPSGFASNAEFIKSKTNGPTAKSFNVNFARLYDQIDSAKSKPGNLFVADDDARAVTEQLIRDAGYDPVYGGELANAHAQEELIKIIFAIAQSGPVFYRYAPPDQL